LNGDFRLTLIIAADGIQSCLIRHLYNSKTRRCRLHASRRCAPECEIIAVFEITDFGNQLFAQNRGRFGLDTVLR